LVEQALQIRALSLVDDTVSEMVHQTIVNGTNGPVFHCILVTAHPIAQ
jgi:hypothetical protein